MLNPWIGDLGRLVEIPFTATENVSRQDRYTTETTVEGRRRAQVRPASPRSWSVSVPLGSGSDLAALAAFATGAWGNGPWHWVPVQAQVGNLLTPGEAQLTERAGISTESIQDAGPVRDSDGNWSPRSVTVTIDAGWGALARDVPVIAGKPFTFSCDVQGGFTPGEIHVAFYDAAGGAMSGGAASAPNAGMHRVSYSTVVPAGAASAQVGVRDGTKVATRPQVTWTPSPVQWSAGHGCRSAIVDGLSEDLLQANRFGMHSKAGFTVMEVF